MIGEIERFNRLIERQEDEIGNATIGRAVSATLRVSPNGSGADGLSWRTAYPTIQAALDEASTDADDCTLILVSPHASNYNINTTGDPTWAANVILQGTHRNWAKVMNTHGTATSVLKLTGKSAVVDLNFNLGTANHGLIMTHGGFRVYSCQFIGEDLTSGGKVALWLDHASGGKHAKVMDCDFRGHATRMIGVYIDQFGYSNFERLRIHECAVGIGFTGANSDENIFNKIDLGHNLLALDIDAGNEQHFHDMIFHTNTVNVDDEVGDHIWINTFGAFPIYIVPDNLAGTAVNTGGAGAWGGDTQLIAAAAIDAPFRIVGTHFESNAVPAEWHQARFSADSGVTWYDMIQFQAAKREGVAAPSGTEFIFNKDTRISCSIRNVSGGDTVQVWIEVQEI